MVPDRICEDDGMPVIADAQRVGEIDVIAVDLAGDPDWGAWKVVPGRVVGTWEGERVSAVLDLVATLPEDEAMRCFVPRYAIRLRRGPLVLAEVAFCFRCHNALGIPSPDNPQTPPWFTFDPDSKPAQELLQLLRSSAD
jgi:hypothetical protein